MAGYGHTSLWLPTGGWTPRLFSVHDIVHPRVEPFEGFSASSWELGKSYLVLFILLDVLRAGRSYISSKVRVPSNGGGSGGSTSLKSDASGAAEGGRGKDGKSHHSGGGKNGDGRKNARALSPPPPPSEPSQSVAAVRCHAEWQAVLLDLSWLNSLLAEPLPELSIAHVLHSSSFHALWHSFLDRSEVEHVSALRCNGQIMIAD